MRNLTPLLLSLIIMSCISFACKEKTKRDRQPNKVQAQNNFKARFGNPKQTEGFWKSLAEEKILKKGQINKLKRIEANNRNQVIKYRQNGGQLSKKVLEDFDLKKRLKYKEYLGDSLYILFAIEEKNINDGKTKHRIIKSN